MNERKQKEGKRLIGLLIALVVVLALIAAAAVVKLVLLKTEQAPEPEGSLTPIETAEPASEETAPDDSAVSVMDLGTLQENAFISKNDGSVRTDTAQYSCTDYLEVQGKYYQIESCALVNDAGICEYDENRLFIRCVLSDFSGTAQFEVSEKAKYLRVSVQNDQKDATILSVIPEDAYLPQNGSDDTLSKWRAATNNRVDNPMNQYATMPPTMTIIDDDTTSVALVQRYHSICEEMGVKGNYAVITSRLEESQELRQLLLQYENQGYGMLYHCYSQSGATYFKKDSRDLALCEENYCRGVRQMREFGFTNYEYWVSPYGVNDQEMQDMCKRHGAKCLISTYNNTFISPDGMTGKGVAERYNIPRCSLGHNTERYPNFTIDALKAQIDQCAAAHGWIVITTHVNEWGDSTQGDDRLREIIRYAQERGFEFKTFAEAFEDRMPMFYLNEILDTPDYSQPAA